MLKEIFKEDSNILTDITDNVELSKIYPFIKIEDNEKVFFLLKNESSEFCFTNKSFIHMYLDDLNSKIIRYDFYRSKITNVSLNFIENTNSYEIFFEIDSSPISLYIRDSAILLIPLYKIISSLEEIFIQNDMILQTANKSLITATEVLNTAKTTDISKNFKEINEYTYTWINSFRNNHTLFDITDLYNKYTLN